MLRWNILVQEGSNEEVPFPRRDSSLAMSTWKQIERMPSWIVLVNLPDLKIAAHSSASTVRPHLWMAWKE